jgi:hypothetical protein
MGHRSSIMSIMINDSSASGHRSSDFSLKSSPAAAACRSPNPTVNSMFLRFLYAAPLTCNDLTEPIGILIENR